MTPILERMNEMNKKTGRSLTDRVVISYTATAVGGASIGAALAGVPGAIAGGVMGLAIVAATNSSQAHRR